MKIVHSLAGCSLLALGLLVGTASQAQINELYQRSHTLDWQPAPADICPFDAPHCLRRFGP